MGNKSALFYKQTLNEICIKYVIGTILGRYYLINKSKHAVAVKSSETMALNTVGSTDANKIKPRDL